WPLLYGGKLFGAGMAVTVAIQHLLGLAIAVVMYRICLGLGVARPVAAVITMPVLLDGYELQIEQNLMAEVWSDAFLLAAVWLLLAWRLRRGGDQPTQRLAGSGPLWWQAGIAGLLIGADVPIRVIGAAAVVPFVAYLVRAGARRRDRDWWRTMLIRTAAGLAGFGIVLGGYLGAASGDTAPGGLSDGGALLYGRAANVANCDQLPLDKYVAQVCPKQPVGRRLGVDTYAWHPMVAHYLPPDGTQARLKIEFTTLVLKHQPLDMAGAMVHDFLKGFAWTKVWSPGDMPPSRWQFQTAYPRWPATDADPWTLYFDHTVPHVVKPLATFLRGYQLSIGYTPGTLLGVAGVVAIAGVLRRRDGTAGLRAESLLAVGIALTLVGGAAIFEFSWRYQLPGLVFFPLAGAIGFAHQQRTVRDWFSVRRRGISVAQALRRRS
ncbi:MAG: hypothetical protein J2P23_13855, partial [Microlunatus sp.]|nr:hypothetical protein [Microlunatus sp.]